jgi:hypothetical protein
MLPLNNDHLSTATTNFGSQGWSLYTGLTVIIVTSFMDDPLNVVFVSTGYLATGEGGGAVVLLDGEEDRVLAGPLS